VYSLQRSLSRLVFVRRFECLALLELAGVQYSHQTSRRLTCCVLFVLKTFPISILVPVVYSFSCIVKLEF